MEGLKGKRRPKCKKEAKDVKRAKGLMESRNINDSKNYRWTKNLYRLRSNQWMQKVKKTSPNFEKQP